MSKDELADLTQELGERAKIAKRCAEIYKDVISGFEHQRDRTNDTIDMWECYNSILNSNQAYEGNSRIYMPIIHNAIESRVVRFTNQVFPSNNRYVEIITENGDVPYAHAALLESYVRKSKLRTKVMPALCRNGDVEGQYTVYVTWKEEKRTVRYRQKEGLELDGLPNSELDGIDDVVNVHEEEIEEGYPDVQVIADSDLVVLPGTSDSVDDALQAGGSVTIAMRLSKGEVKKMIDDGTFIKERGERLTKGFSVGGNQKKDTQKELASAAGIKVHGGGKYALVYQTWSILKVGGKRRLCVMYFGGDNLLLSCKLNPYWCDRCPIISVPIKKIAGVFKGISQVAPCAPMQYAANDAINEGMDSATYSLLPIVMTDPEKNPRIGSMVMNLAAIWQTSPQDTQFVQFPQLWQEAFEIAANCQGIIFQTLGVNPAMITSGSKGKKSQAEMANEQQVDVLTTADAVTILEEGILTPLLERFYDYDRQFREEPQTVRAYGEMGLRAKMEVAEPIQDNNKWVFRWFGVEQARSAQRIQQQIAAINVIRGVPPQLYAGRTLDMVPFIENLAMNAFGPTLSPLVFKDERDKLSVDPAQENDLLNQGFEVHVHPMDNDQEHIQSHTADLTSQGDPSGFLRIHIMAHQQQLQQKQQAANMPQGGQQGVPGGAGPGVAGTPRPGAQPAQPSNVKQPAGAVNQDRMQDPSAMPRKM